MLAGLYKVYGLIYLVSSERNLVRFRTNYRHEDIYLYLGSGIRLKKAWSV